MKRILLLLSFCFLLLPMLHAQKVGLVLSGGGAKGMTHIGIIRALEENNIPIDYITGTSMGAIIGSLYAMGYSPDDMEALLRSEDFKRWYSGKVEPKYAYYFKKSIPTPEFFNIRFDFKDSLNVKPQLPTSMVNPIQMNLVFVELFARATAACDGDFDRLFVPFRCIASDVYNKRQIVLGKGDLGDAVRASMSFPFVFKPIEIDSVLAYDGGIYNNFPTDVMRDDFHPDIIIGSVVAANPSKPKENDLMSQIENMVMQKTDYSIPDSVGILMTFKYDDVNLLDFDRLQELHDIGYNRTLSLMDSIKGRIHRRVNADNVRLRRLVYRSNLPQLYFQKIYIDGANSQQQAYIQKEFHDEEDEPFTYEDLKRKDKISTQKKSLRSLIKEMEDEVLASAGVDSFEEIFKLIFTKLYDELICANDPTAYLQFRNTGDTDYELKEKIQGLFDDAKKKWEGIFTDESKILLSPSHLAVCVASLQDIKLFNNNLDVVDDAFEYLMSKAQKGEKGQYFTPRYVIDMCVKMMNPTTKDKIIDTACGSSGFTVHSIFKVWKDIRRGKGLPEGDGFTAAERKRPILSETMSLPLTLMKKPFVLLAR